MVVERGETPGDQEGFVSYHSVAPPHLGLWHKVQPVGSWPSAFGQGPYSHQKVCDSALSLWLRTAMADGAAYIACFLCTCAHCLCSHTHTQVARNILAAFKCELCMFVHGEGCIESLFVCGSFLLPYPLPQVLHAALFSNQVANCCLLRPPGSQPLSPRERSVGSK